MKRILATAARSPLQESIADVPVQRVREGVVQPAVDRLAVEEPLEIRLVHGAAEERASRNVAVTMRTPGHDVELALGFLYGEGIVRRRADVADVEHQGPGGCKAQKRNVVTVHLAPGVTFDGARLERHFYTTSSCGVCGKTSLAALEMAGCPVLPAGQPLLTAARVHSLPGLLRAAQAVFEETGGLHAAALFDPEGRLLGLREDVGRHNAVDKLVGACLLHDALPHGRGILFVSGRASFELTQKALMAGFPVMAAVSAPSSLAVELAQSYGMTLLGFVRDGRFNVYAGAERLQDAEHLHAADASTNRDDSYEVAHQG